MLSLLTQEQIESVIAALPVQGRIMLRLLLLQHFDVTQADIEYMAVDRPDPRAQAGQKVLHHGVTRDAVKAVVDRRDQYLRQVRLRRERTSLQARCLRKMTELREALAKQAEHMLQSTYGVSEDTFHDLRAQARSAIPKPAVRVLEQRWDNNEIAAEDYTRDRLRIELQTHVRLAEKYRKRLDLAEREWQTANASQLQDHELSQIWGIPAGALAARKVKYLHQYLQALQQKLQNQPAAHDPSKTAPLDLWQETLTVLAGRPVERSVSTYDGLERTEAALLEKLTAFAWGTMPEEVEAKFWLSLVQGASSNAVHAELTRSLFGLQRLAAILAELDTSPASLEEALLARVTPRAKTESVELLEEKPAEPVLGEMGEHVLKSMLGEQHPDLHGSRRS